MRCCSCQRNIAAGAEAQKMIVEYQQPDGSSKIFGFGMTDGPMAKATGRMFRGWHHLCYHVARKRAARGDAVTGRVLANTPTAYDIDQLVMSKDDLDALGLTQDQARDRGTLFLSTKLNRLREIAAGVGKGVGDPTVQEAFAADEHGGPYAHQHTHRLEMYQLIAHLEYAHGITDAKLLHSHGGLNDLHGELHVSRTQHDIRARREAEGEPEPRPRDWRTQYSAELDSTSAPGL